MLETFYNDFENILAALGRFKMAQLVDLEQSQGLSIGNHSAFIDGTGACSIDTESASYRLSAVRFLRLKHCWNQIIAFDEAVASLLETDETFVKHLRHTKLPRFATFNSASDLCLSWSGDEILLEDKPFSWRLSSADYKIWLTLYQWPAPAGTYGELLQYLKRADASQLLQTVTIYVNDEFLPASLGVNKDSDILDSGHLYFAPNG